MLGSKTKRELKINQRRILIDSIEISIPSPQQVLTWGERMLPNGKSVGEIKNSKTVNYKRFTPLRDGLFCERIFGPVNSFICACGKRQPRADITFCDKCEVEYTEQRTRRYRLGYIPLVSPVAHIWYLKGRPSYISLFLGKRKKKILALAYCNAYLVEQAFSKSLDTTAQTLQNNDTTNIRREGLKAVLLKEDSTKSLAEKSTFLQEATSENSDSVHNPFLPIQESWLEKRKENETDQCITNINSSAKIRQVSKSLTNATKLELARNRTRSSNSQKQKLDVKSAPFIVLQENLNNKPGPSSFGLLLLEVLGQIEKHLVLIDSKQNKNPDITQNKLEAISAFSPQNTFEPFQMSRNKRDWTKNESPSYIKDKKVPNMGSSDKEMKKIQSSFSLKALWGYTYSKENLKDLRKLELLVHSNRNPISVLFSCLLSEHEQKIPYIFIPTVASSTSSRLSFSERNSSFFEGRGALPKRNFQQKIEKKTNKIFSTNTDFRDEIGETAKKAKKVTLNFYKKKAGGLKDPAFKEGRGEKIEAIKEISAKRLHRIKNVHSRKSLKVPQNLSILRAIKETNFCNNVQHLRREIRSYHRAQTLPFLPSFICKYNVRDELLNFFDCSPLTEDIPIPIYCNVPRWTPLRNVHQFMSEQVLSPIRGNSFQLQKKMEQELVKDQDLPLQKNVSTDTTTPLRLKVDGYKKNTLAEELASVRHVLYVVLLQKSSSSKSEDLGTRIHCLSALLTSFSREKLIQNSIRLSTNRDEKASEANKKSSPVLRHIDALKYQAEEQSALSDKFKNKSLYIQSQLTRLQKTSSVINVISDTTLLALHRKENNQNNFELIQPYSRNTLLTKGFSYAPPIAPLSRSSIAIFDSEQQGKARSFKITSPKKFYSALLYDTAWIRSSVLQKNMSYLPVVNNIALARLPLTENLHKKLSSGTKLQKAATSLEKNRSNQIQIDLRRQAFMVPSLVHAFRQQVAKKKELKFKFLKPSLTKTSSFALLPLSDLLFALRSLSQIANKDRDSDSVRKEQKKQKTKEAQKGGLTNLNSLNHATTWPDNLNNFQKNEYLFVKQNEFRKKATLNNTLFKSISVEEKRLVNKNFSSTAGRSLQLERNPFPIGRLPLFDCEKKTNKYLRNGSSQAAIASRSASLPPRSRSDSGESQIAIVGRDSDRIATAKPPKQAKKQKQNSTLSPLELTTIREILAYTGGGSLQQLLQRFDTQLFAIFLLGDIQATRTLYKKRVTQKGFPSNRFDKRVLTRLCRRIYKNSRRLKLAQLLTRCKRLPEWMLVSTLPVLPPDLRPILQMSESVVVASDLNNLYQRVIYRNNRFQKLSFIDFHLVTAIQRLVQDAVDRLIENGRGGSKPFYTPGGRPLKSLSDTLKGKKGRFRLNLLGKRVDFSGRSVIVVSPKLKIHECGLPREIALELYHYFLLRHFMLKKEASSIVMAKKIIKQRNPSMWNTLRALIYHHPVLLNRAPTLHRLGIQAFQPKLVRGNAILLHPLVCSSFNADFDGDQMGVHLPLCIQARAEAWDLLWSRNNLLSPATGQPVLVPSQDMVLGFYYMTQIFSSRSFFALDQNKKKSITQKNNLNSEYRGRNILLAARNFTPADSLFLNWIELVKAFQHGQIALHTPIWLKWDGKVEHDEEFAQPLELRVNSFGLSSYLFSNSKRRKEEFLSLSNLYIRTTAGRVLVNQILFSLSSSSFHF